MTGASCSFPSDILKLYRSVYPHISLAKWWLDVGEIVTKCEDCTVWERRGTLLFNPAPQAYGKTVNWTTNTMPRVHLQSVTQSWNQDVLLTEIECELLKTIPDSLWSKGPADVGIMKGVEPVKITTKSSFRPHQRQYPLKPVAEEGIQPFITALLTFSSQESSTFSRMEISSRLAGCKCSSDP